MSDCGTRRNLKPKRTFQQGRAKSLASVCPVPPSRRKIYLTFYFISTTIKNKNTVGAGSIRGNRSYKGEPFFSYAHLKSEIPFDTLIVCLDLPGKVVSDMICFTRGFASLTPPIEKGAYLQCDEGVGWDRGTNSVSSIAGEPVSESRIYRW